MVDPAPTQSPAPKYLRPSSMLNRHNPTCCSSPPSRRSPLRPKEEKKWHKPTAPASSQKQSTAPGSYTEETHSYNPQKPLVTGKGTSPSPVWSMPSGAMFTLSLQPPLPLGQRFPPPCPLGFAAVASRAPRRSGSGPVAGWKRIGSARRRRSSEQGGDVQLYC